jgi:cellulose synthase/poly-beta-1,6-N-acetylglucosamine synthase-like glycosyltransferase
MWAKFMVFLFESIYVLSLVGMAIFGFNSFILALLYLGKKQEVLEDQQNDESIESWPRVTVQLPIYNERYMVERLIKSVTNLDWPRQQLQIQVLDDSTDITAKLVHLLVAKYQAQGFDIQLIHRRERTGYKAGALANGLKQTSGEFIAIFDADFVPDPDWLKQTIPQFKDERLGCLQTRWGHLNHDYNSLTRAESLGIDGHFIVEQTARSRNGLFLNFNGTAGLWRKAAIEDAGGWQSDTLTEDLDLSYRAQLRGWHIGYLPYVVVPAELPAQIDAFKNQQFRWAKGSIQTVRKLLPQILRANVGWGIRLGAVVHILGYTVQPLMLIMLILTLPVSLWSGGLQHVLSYSSLIAFGPPFLYAVSSTEYKPRLWDRLRILPLLVLTGFGLTLNNSVAVFEGLFTNGGDFRRTPKFNLLNQKGSWSKNAYALPHNPLVWGELLLALYAIFTIVVLWPKYGWTDLPWMLTYVAGYLYVAGMSFIQSWQHHRSSEGVSHQGGNRRIPA